MSGYSGRWAPGVTRAGIRAQRARSCRCTGHGLCGACEQRVREEEERRADPDVIELDTQRLERGYERWLDEIGGDR